MTVPFRVGITADFLTADGRIGFGDIGLDLLDAEGGIAHGFLSRRENPLAADLVAGYDALIVNAPRVTAESLALAGDRLTVLCRYGVGYDSVDLDACTAAGVAVTITPDGARRPVANMVMTFLLALSHRLFEKDRATRTPGGWQRKLDMMGYWLSGQTLGIVGFGNIGAEVAKLAAVFDLRIIAADPYADPARASAMGVELVDLETLLRRSDYVAITCALTAETRGMISRERLGLMKPTAFLINAARGPIVDQAALVDVLREGRIRGAATDVFEVEPVDPAEPLLQLDNVIVAPHALCWTEEWAYITGQSVMRNIIRVKQGEVPEHVVNRAVLETPAFRQKLAAYAAKG